MIKRCEESLQFGVFEFFDQRCGGQRFRHRSLAECNTDRHRVRLDVTSMPLRQHCEGTKPLWKAAGTGHLAELAAKNGQMLMMCMKHGDVLTRSRCVILRRCDAKAAKELGDCHGIPLSNGKRSGALQLFRYALSPKVTVRRLFIVHGQKLGRADFCTLSFELYAFVLQFESSHGTA